MSNGLYDTPPALILNDPFQLGDESIPIQGNHPCALDSCHYAALVIQGIEEKLGPPLDERSPYDQRFLDTFLGIRYRFPRLLQASLDAIVYSDNLLIPNIDIHPGELIRDPNRVVQFSAGGGYHFGSQENLAFLLKLAPLVLNHPIAKRLKLNAESYKDSVERWLGFKDYPNLVKEKELGS